MAPVAPKEEERTFYPNCSAMSESLRSSYALRNHPGKTFELTARTVPSPDENQSTSGCTVRVDIAPGGGEPFQLLIEFGGDFVATKREFTESMYLGTALSVATSQLESLRHRSTRLKVHRASGLIDTEPL